MNIMVFQAPYPKEATVVSAAICLNWMRTKLNALKSGEQDLILLPEYANAPGLNDKESARAFAAEQGTAFLNFVAAKAKSLHCQIALAGIMQCNKQWYNRGLIFDANGETAFAYDKVHLTQTEKEDLGLTPGEKQHVFQFGKIRIGFAICFDMYFPEHFEALATLQTDIVLCPSYQRSESSQRIAIISQARAHDSGTYVIRSSYAMENSEVGGRSMILAPDATILADAGAEASVITAEIDPKEKFMKPACHGAADIEHRKLLASHRKANAQSRAKKLDEVPSHLSYTHRGLSFACLENTLYEQDGA